MPISRAPLPAFRIHFVLLSLGSSITALLQLCISDAVALGLGRKIRITDTGSAIACDQFSRRWLNGRDSHLDVVARLDLADVDDSSRHSAGSDRLPIFRATEFGRWSSAVQHFLSDAVIIGHKLHDDARALEELAHGAFNVAWRVKNAPSSGLRILLAPCESAALFQL